MLFRRLNRSVASADNERQVESQPRPNRLSAELPPSGVAAGVPSREERIVVALIRKLESADSRAALAAEVELLAFGAAAGPVLVNALAGYGWGVRARIARVLGKLGCANAIPWLLFFFRNDRPDQGEHYTGSLEPADEFSDRITSPEPLEWTRIDGRVHFKLQVVRALEAIGGTEGVVALSETLDDNHPDLQRYSAMALRSLAREQPCPALRASFPRLRRIVSGWPTGDHKSRSECRLLISEIERVTVATEQFPVPAGPVAPSAQSLPRAHPYAMDAENEG